jgi:soluble lytic murein transglycosylase
MRTFLCTIILFCVAASLDAAIYRYVDPSGRVHFTDVPTDTLYRIYRDDNPARQLEDLIQHYARRFRLESALVKAVIKVESDFDAKVISRRGAQGLMQLMPETAREVGVTDPFDPDQSIYGGTYYLRRMLDRFNSNLDHALAAYNAGPNAVQQYGGVPPFNETRDYVIKVKSYFDYYRNQSD